MEVLRAILIHLAAPSIGLCVYLWLCRKMRDSAIERPPYVPLFILFGAYGGWLLILLTLGFWKWSGMASFGAIALSTITPVAMLVMAIYLFPLRKISAYHEASFIASVFYIGFVIFLAFVITVSF
jgi:hypothetical protein